MTPPQRSNPEVWSTRVATSAVQLKWYNNTWWLQPSCTPTAQSTKTVTGAGSPKHTLRSHFLALPMYSSELARQASEQQDSKIATGTSGLEAGTGPVSCPHAPTAGSRRRATGTQAAAAKAWPREASTRPTSQCRPVPGNSKPAPQQLVPQPPGD